MTEKRFKLGVDEQYGAILDNDKIMRKGEIVELLNELHEENRELQRHLDVMRSGALTDDRRIKELYNENEQLKNKIEKLHDLIFRLRTENAFDRATEKQSTITAKEFLDELDKW